MLLIFEFLKFFLIEFLIKVIIAIKDNKMDLFIVITIKDKKSVIYDLIRNVILKIKKYQISFMSDFGNSI